MLTEDNLRQYADKEVFDCRATNVLSSDQLMGLGKVAAEWGMLEAAINRHAGEVLGLGFAFQLLTGNAVGRRVALILINAAPSILSHEPSGTIDELVECLRKIERLADKRNEC